MTVKKTPNSEPTEGQKKQLYNLYKAIYHSKLDNKRNKLMTYLFAWEDWSWRIEGISKGALQILKEKKFYPKPKGLLVRHHHKQNRATTYEEMLKKEMSFEHWWSYFWENDVTYLITKTEHDDINSIKLLDKDIVKINWTDGYFKGGGLVGFKYLKSIEAVYVKQLCDDNNI